MAKKRLFFQKKDAEEWLDEKFFKELFDHYWPNLFGFCCYHIQDEEVSREIVQDLFLSLWERRNQLIINVNIGHYLYRAARLQIVRFHRDQIYERQRIDNVTTFFSQTANNTEERVYARDLDRYIAEVVDTLPPKCRKVYLMSRRDGLSISEIANALNLSIKTVEAHLTKALRHLRTELRAAEV
ncbi:RNA polymerase sigma-70 factor [Olivibacter ginsenosidimutans]|uniref:RNA polymerase sigma-70 factor n=1 Tax=Olivibacter ginsenosidimutans TaxID=1176537 RepID=A0ABP9AWT5_9SPHI